MVAMRFMGISHLMGVIWGLGLGSVSTKQNDMRLLQAELRQSSPDFRISLREDDIG